MHTNGMKVIVAIAALFALAACSREITRTATATANNDDDITVVFGNGQSATGMDEYEAAIAANPPPIDEENSFELTVSSSADAGPLFAIGKFKIRVFVSSNYLAGCINQKMPHLVIQVTNDLSPMPLVELHIAGWFSGKAPCLGLLNESVVAYGFCIKGCFTNSKNGIKTSVKDGLIAAGVSGTVAAILSSLAAPLIAPALGL
jgi:hypothetical protein